MGSNLFTSALSGMNAAQLGMATTQHNIANASTPGFTRQQVLVASRAGNQTGSGFIGQGVDTTAVVRIYDQFLNTQVLQEQAQASYLSTYHTAMKQIDNLVADPVAGASPAIQEFFNAVNGVANNPESAPARQSLLGAAQFVADRFRAIDQRLTDIANGNTTQISGSVNAINTYAQQIATLNTNIKIATNGALGQQPNDLLDQRDQLISQLNKEIKVSVLSQSDGTVSVFIGNGQALVLDEHAMALRTVQSSSDPSKVDIAYQNGSSLITMQQTSLQGGKLGGYLTFRDQSLEPARSALGLVAMGLAISVNQQNQLGQDLNGTLGGNIFNNPIPRVDKNANNTGTAEMSATITDIASVTTSDYRLSFDGVSYSMMRLSDNAITSLGALPQTVDGITVNLASGVAAAGDSFLIRPAINGAKDIDVIMSNPAKIAAAAPVRSNTALTNLGAGTIAAATVISGLPLNANMQLPVTMTFNDPPTTYSLTSTNAAIDAVGTTVTVASTVNMTVGMPVTGGDFPAGTTIASITNGTTFVTSAAATTAPATGQTLQVGSFPYIPGGVSLSDAAVSGTNVTVASTANLVVGAPVSGGGFPPGTVVQSITSGTVFVTSAAATPATATGQSLHIGNTFNGWVAQISGEPIAGDVFSIGSNTNATGDNRNALLLASLQTQNLMAGGTTNFQGAYGQMVGAVGSKTHELDVTSQAQTAMVAQTVAAQQAVSGVNLDEEAANLLQYQRAYQAAAKALQVSNTMFDALLSL